MANRRTSPSGQGTTSTPRATGVATRVNDAWRGYVYFVRVFYSLECAYIHVLYLHFNTNTLEYIYMYMYVVELLSYSFVGADVRTLTHRCGKTQMF